MSYERLPAPVRPVLAAWVGEALAALGDAVDGVCVFGGIALGDFAPRWSDVDLCVALRRAPSPAEVDDLARRHRRLFERFVRGGEAAWCSQQFIEGVLIETARLDVTGPMAGVQMHDGDVRALEAIELEPFDRLQIAGHALLLFGKSPVVQPPSDVALARQLRRDLDALELSTRRSPVWMAAMLHWAARSSVWWRDGDFVGKGEALEREIGRGGDLERAYRLALRCREEGASATARHEAPLRDLFEEARPRIVARLAPYA